MRRTFVGIGVMAAMLLAAAAHRATAQSDFKVCDSTYALCTTSKCTPVEGKGGQLSCTCDVKTGFWAGLEPCQDAKETAEGTAIRSRYFPVKSYVACANDRPWAWCLDKPCIIDPDDPNQGDLRLHVDREAGSLRDHHGRLFCRCVHDRHLIVGNGQAT